MNSGNKYNDNFYGLYCTCKRPYPDPDDEVRNAKSSSNRMWTVFMQNVQRVVLELRFREDLTLRIFCSLSVFDVMCCMK